MQNFLMALIFMLLTGCSALNSKENEIYFMSEQIIKGVSLSLKGPSTLPLSVVLRESPDYDGSRNLFTVSLKNESSRTIKLPLDELRRNVVLVYRNSFTGAEIIDNRTPPSKLDGSIEKLGPGETKAFQVVFAYPEVIASQKGRAEAFTFCVKWDANWLRTSAYSPNAYDWNESFLLCQEIRIVER
ncbi:hypothetical protein FFZ99_08415 [Leptospira interrogans]|uniref:Uncharacterized protein n=2 Tax=Leptospiraceae TaxID=170 RepID=A0AA41BJP7_LEPIR|nr:hypothetical protein LEP1GSC045_1158 [Leptospira interrogans serovar Pomona str. Kennewicki LC82-25]EKN97585.1 hypothetical protein LEP1GSC014_4236 [Leptospira interrogans serovar Pomona str. Pomona]EMF33825.1 hypothetical protein LEP1GSC201_1543 [Leptospira interrogans serovar Pomona str. Fox 32256]EMI71509.1 hypothetical protein LEP1GSC200_0523 [Leptospira interrogans serovar Pomona str. CSL10083]EMJ60608.1 hypothetical protein LEP1GSC197_0809 [Leptospira interrogans serovar Pomona str. CS